MREPAGEQMWRAPMPPAVAGSIGRQSAQLDSTALGDDELLVTLDLIEHARRSFDAAVAHHVAELDRRGLTEPDTGLRTAGWLGRTHKMAGPTARALIRVGAFLTAHPATDAALTEGRLTLDHVKVLDRNCTDRVADVFDRIEGHLIDLAAECRFEPWAQAVRALLDLADADGGHAPRPDDNRLTLADGFDGDSLHLVGNLVGAEAVEVRAALEAEADRLFRQRRREHDATGGLIPLPTRAQLLAEALVELCRRGRATTRNSTSTPIADVTLVVEGDPHHQPCHHEHHSDAEPHDHDEGEGGRSNSGSYPGNRPAGSAGRLDTANGHELHHWLDGLRVRTLNGLPLRRRTAEVFCCDPQLRALVMTADGEPLWHGRAKRLATTAQRNAAALRDGGCCFPGCDAPPNWCDLHHLHWWDRDHGPTDLPNLPMLCRRHHRLIHTRRWTISELPGQHYEFTSPTGTVHPAQRHGRPAPPPHRTPDREPDPA